MEDQEKCTTQSALNVDKNVKFHSNLTQADRYTAESVMLNEGPREEIDIKQQPKSILVIQSFLYPFFVTRLHVDVKSIC
jgi:hypothetical protein